MINYFSLLLPICLIYMGKYYILKHDYKELALRYHNVTQIKKRKRLSGKQEQYEEK